ncbi:hypothetical protein LTR66_010635 [Elasticomyces elasticus]|nr:hypothetical protein LTR28_007894 [Elasticomyces elasticus]KAK4978343.1 hypothetical protein LTR66_010635 [Elasticomyces elasticus]
MPLVIPQNTSWQDTAALVQKHRDETISAVAPAIPEVPSELPLNVISIPSQLLSHSEITITQTLPEDLLAALATGQLTSTNVTNAFLRRAGLAQKLVNCVTELLPDRALERARYLDEYFTRHGEPIGPLHGLPISVKEHVGMKDLDLNAGFVSWVGRTGPANAYILDLLWNAGAVFYVRTTQPQTLMHLEAASNVHGVTVNPYNRALTSGGSSGGEGALMGMRGSCLGIGTDIGGSIRSPAANNGVYGLRPTSYRLPLVGCAATMLGQEHIVAVIGPLSTSVGGIKVFMKTIIDQKPWMGDPSLLPFPWRDTARDGGSLLKKDKTSGRRGLKIGVLADDGVVRPHPPILRALKTLVGRSKGQEAIEIVEFPPYKHDLAWTIISSLYFADNGSEEKEAIESSGEPWRPLSRFIITDNRNVKEMDVREVWRMTGRREVYRAEYLAHWNKVGIVPKTDGEATETWPANVEDEQVDVLLCPVGPGAAPPLDNARYWGYTAQWNVLDYPALVFPTGLHVEPELDKREDEYQARNADDQFNYNRYEPERYRDTPISLQLVGRRYEDEKVMEAFELIKEISGLPF